MARKKKIKIIEIIQNWDEGSYFVYFNNDKYSRYDVDMTMVSPEDIKSYVEKQLEIDL